MDTTWRESENVSCVLQSDLEEQVWVDEQDLFPFGCCVKTLAVGAVKKR